MTNPTDFDPIEVPDSSELERNRTLFITPNGDRSIRLKTSYQQGRGMPLEVLIDLTPAALVDALNRIPGFVAAYTRPAPPAPKGVGAVVRSTVGKVWVRTDLKDEPWRSADNEGRGPFWAFDEKIEGILADGGEILSEGVVL